MLLRRLFHPRLAQSSYLIACSASRDAIVVDPHRDIGIYLAAAESEGVRITAVTETHVHADFLSGSQELAARTGARLYLSGEGRGAWSYTDEFIRTSAAVLLQDGYAIRLGGVRLDVIHTPGHTPEHITLLVTDTASSDEPMGAVTGDFLFVGDIGRPDLLERAVHVGGSAEIGARQLYRSLRRLSTAADYLQIWPGHSAGSACGKGLSAVPHSTLGYERRHNWAVRIGDESQFVREVLHGQPEAPAYFAEMKRLNARGSRPWSDAGARGLSGLDEVAKLLASGTMVIDTRPGAEFAAAHIPSTVHIPLDRSFLSWAGSLIAPSAPVALIGDEATLAEAVRDLALIGTDRVVACAGPQVIDAWRQSGRPIASIQSVSARQLATRLQHGAAAVLDVRGLAERAGGYIPGSTHIPLAELPERLSELTRNAPLVVHCQSGARSTIATSFLMARGFTAIENLEGGLGAWREAEGVLEGENGARGAEPA
jgi:hydroxyacylglutathione hydrolase